MESEGPESAVLHVVAHGRAVRKAARLAERERRMLAAASCIYVCFMSACILHSRRCHILLRVLSLSLLLSPPASTLPSSLSPRDVYSAASFLLIKSRPPRLLSRLSSFLSFLRFHPRFANRARGAAGRSAAGVNELGKANALHRKRGTREGGGRGGGRKARYNIASVCLIDRLSR